MNISDYQMMASRTIPLNSKSQDLLANFCFGLMGEGGELIDHMKKHLYHGHAIDRSYVMKEMGDVLWYIAGLATALQIDLQEVSLLNIEKLKKRYPAGFSQANSINREE